MAIEKHHTNQFEVDRVEPTGEFGKRMNDELGSYLEDGERVTFTASRDPGQLWRVELSFEREGRKRTFGLWFGDDLAAVLGSVEDLLLNSRYYHFRRLTR